MITLYVFWAGFTTYKTDSDAHFPLSLPFISLARALLTHTAIALSAFLRNCILLFIFLDEMWCISPHLILVLFFFQTIFLI